MLYFNAKALLVAVASLLCFVSSNVYAKNGDGATVDEEINLEKIKASICDSNGFQCANQGEFLLVSEPDGFRAVVTIDSARKLVTYIALFQMSPEASEVEKLTLVNRLNDKLIFVRFSMSTPTLLWCDYGFRYEGGVSPQFIDKSYGTFSTVVKGAIKSEDPNHLVKEGQEFGH